MEGRGHGASDPTGAGPASEQLADFAAGLTSDDVGPATRRAVRRTLTDFLACSLAGSRLPQTEAVLAHIRALEGAGPATVIGHADRLAPAQAAFVNGVSAHGLDFDDGHTRGSAHPGGVIHPVVLALGQQVRATPEQVVLAIVVGYDVMLRLCAAIHPGSARRGWHNTAVAGVFGATAAAGRLLGVDRVGMRHAFGLAGSFAGGLRQFLAEGADVKRLHPAKAARDGILCAGLAAQGLTGPSDILDGSLGFFAAFVDGQVDRDQLLGGLGSRFLVEDVYFKPYPCCRHFHAAVEGVIRLRNKLGAWATQIEAIEVGLYRAGYHGHDHKHGDNLLDAQMSAPVSVALAADAGQLSIATYAAANLARPEIAELVRRTDVVIDPECDAAYPARRSARVTLRLRDGSADEIRILDPKGEGENELSDSEIDAKFIDNAGGVLGEARARLVLGMLHDLGSLDGIARLAETLRST